MMWCILPLTIIGSLIWLTTSAKPPLDCNYVAFPEVCLDSNNCAQSSYASPIDVCWVTYDFDTATSIASIYQCVNGNVSLSVWSDVDECSDTIPPNATFAVESVDYKCNSQKECPYTVTETYFIPSGTECITGEVPISLPHTDEYLIIIGHCFGMDLGETEPLYISYSQSLCDATGLSTYRQYVYTLECVDNDQTLIDNEVTTSGDGVCATDSAGDTWFQRETACIPTPAPTPATLGCNYVAFPIYERGSEDYLKNQAVPMDVCFMEVDPPDVDNGIPNAKKFTCNDNAVFISIWSNALECSDSVPDMIKNVTSSGFECDSSDPCPYFIIEHYDIPSATCTNGVVPSSGTPEQWLFVTDHCFASARFDRSIHASCDAGTSTYSRYDNLDCNGQATGGFTVTADGVCSGGADFYSYRDITCMTTNPPTSASNAPTSAPTALTSAPKSASNAPTTPTAPTAPTNQPSDTYITFTIAYISSDAVISQVEHSIEQYVASIPVDIDYSFTATPQNHVVIYLYGSDSELAYVDQNALLEVIESDLRGSIETTYNDMNDGKENVTGAQENNFETITFVIMILLALFIMMAVLDGKKLRKNDYFQIGALMSASLQILDCISDILFAVRITNHSEFVMIVSLSSPLLILFILSIFFILLPVAASVFQLHSIIHKYWWQNDQLRGWLREYMYLLFMVSFVCGSSFSAIQLCASNAFDLRFFAIPLSKMDRSHFQYKRVYSVVLLENAPQLVIALCFAIITGEDSQNNDIVYISMTFSAMSIIMMAISARATKLLLETQDHGVITMHVTGNMFGHDIAHCRKRTNPLRDRMSVLLGVDQALLEIPKPQQIHQGLRIEIILLMNHTTMEEEEIAKKIADASMGKDIAEFMGKSWKLEGTPSVDIVKFEQNVSKRRTIDMGMKTKSNTETDQKKDGDHVTDTGMMRPMRVLI